MNRQIQELQFISKFVDSVTIRPFFEDLQRVQQIRRLFGQLPQRERFESTSTEAA